MNKATEGRPATNAHGDLLITATVEHDGIALRVSDGVQVIDGLTKTFTDHAQAAAYYRHVAQAAEQGKRIHQIVWEVQALQEAQTAATGRTAEQVRDALRAEVDAHQADVTTAHNQTVTVVAEVMAGTTQTGGWVGARKAAQQTAAPASEPMARILAQAKQNGGRIIRSRQATSTQLVALANRGLVELTYRWRGNQRVITGATLVRTLGQVAA